MQKRIMHMAGAGVILMLAITLPGSAWALGLGQIQSDTHIGQTLEARIPILVNNQNNLQGLRVGLASPDAYKRAGLELSDYLYTLEFAIKQSASGPYVLVTSPQSVKMPFLNILVRARWTSGEVTRQYTLLLNPPVFASAQNQAAKTAPVQPVESGSETAQQILRPTQQASGQPDTEAGAAGTAARTPVESYGPVRRGDTLWGIASRLHGSAGVGVNQMIIAIYRANPQAFSGNINRLKAGAVLKVPTREQITQVPSRVATSQIRSQNQSWRAFKAGRDETARLASNTQGEGSFSGRIESSRAAAQPAAGNQETAASTTESGTGSGTGSGAGTNSAAGGEVVLTAPRVTENVSGAPGGEPSGSEAASQEAANAGQTAAAGAGLASAGSMTGDQTLTDQAGEAAGNATGKAASSGGPLKVHNAELAALTSGQSAAQNLQSGTEPQQATGVQTAAVAAVAAGQQSGESKAAEQNAAQQPTAGGMPAVDTASSTGAGNPGAARGEEPGIVLQWLTSPKGWIVIALIVILLVLVLVLLLRRRSAGNQWSAQESDASGREPDDEAERESDEHEWEPVSEERLDDDEVRAGAIVGADQDDERDEDDLMGDYPETEQSREEADAEVADALVEADFHAGSGDHAGAARSLERALSYAPERDDLRLRRMEELYASADGEGFLEEAGVLHARISETSADWQAVVVMGRQLLPREALFMNEEERARARPEDAAETEGEASGLDFEQELDQLTRTEPSPGLQDDFEETLGELSTMIETYMPEDGSIPAELQATQGEKLAGQRRPELEGTISPGEDDEMLELEPREALDSDAEANRDADPEDPQGASGPGDQADFQERHHQSNVLMHLELARSYLDMGDRYAAREMLKDVLDSGDDAQREEARKLLDELDAEREDTDSTDGSIEPAGDEIEPAGDEDDLELTLEDEGSDESIHGDGEFDNSLDLARAYIEMGDQESARNVLEEILDSNSETQRQAARELLATMET
ncbi:MAG: hypothetical protein L0I62_01685 [Gammaproteobacteria bacterium]|nr:hypothetical protein [Gammaproteobacteria bacterium]